MAANNVVIEETDNVGVLLQLNCFKSNSDVVEYYWSTVIWFYMCTIIKLFKNIFYNQKFNFIFYSNNFLYIKYIFHTKKFNLQISHVAKCYLLLDTLPTILQIQPISHLITNKVNYFMLLFLTYLSFNTKTSNTNSWVNFFIEHKIRHFSKFNLCFIWFREKIIIHL